MGMESGVICNDCDTAFAVSSGSGFFFHLLHCDTCGERRSVGFDELGDVHLRYLKGLRGPYAIISKEFDEQVQAEYEGEPIDETEYPAEIARIAGECECGGAFSFEASPRCPNCHGTDSRADPDGDTILYD